MSTAWISGQARQAVIDDGRAVYLLSHDEAGPPVLCSPRHLQVQRSLYRADLRAVPADRFPFPKIRGTLQQAVAIDRARSYALSLLDRDIDRPLRLEVAGELEALLGAPEVQTAVDNLLRSAPLPAEADIEGAVGICDEAEAGRTGALLRRLKDEAPLVQRAASAWEELAREAFDSDAEAEQAWAWLVEAGGMSRLADALGESSTNVFRAWVLSVARNAPLGLGRSPIKLLLRLEEIARQQAEGPDPQVLQETDEDLFPEEEEQDPRTWDKQRSQIFESVKKQIDATVRALREGREDAAEKYIQDLVAFQRARGGGRYLAKSLSSIAAQARSLGNIQFAVRALRQAVQEAPEDGWSWHQLSIVLSDVGLSAEAEVAAQRAIALRGDVADHTGRAEVLKAMGRLPEALTAYQDTLSRFPDNAVAHTGRAEVLKALGRLSDALIAYQDTLSRFPDDVVAHNGRAEVLKALGRLPEALTAYQDTISRFPDDVFAHNGRAEVLKALGRLPEALTAYQDTISRFPDNVVTHTGRAEVLKALGRLSDALTAYQDTLSRFPDDVVAHNGRAEVLKALGRLPEALTAYQDTLSRFPDDVFARNGRAEVLKALGRLPEALTAYQDTVSRFPDNVVAHNGRAHVLVLMGRTDDALEVLPASEPQTLQEWIGYHIRGMIFLRAGDLEQAEGIFRHGVAACSFAAQRSYFLNALTATLIRRRRIKEAIKHLEPHVGEMTGNQLVTGQLLLAHAYGERAQIRRTDEAAAERWLNTPMRAMVPMALALQHDLAEYYQLRLAGQLIPLSRPVSELATSIAEKELVLLA